MKKPAACVMVLGTSSGAGKSWLATALCRYYRNLGLKVAPFKAQNMTGNTRAVPLAQADGGPAWAELATAQYVQALAAGVAPDVRHSPLLLKPQADNSSQVWLLGQYSAALSATPWRERRAVLWPQITQALDALRAEHDVVVIEGAGSPAEINLASSDVVNSSVAEYTQAACLLVSNIDRGGAFAHLYGTWALVSDAQRELLRGFVLNQFRGDASLLSPAPELLQEKTGLPTLAVLPMLADHGLPEEDGVAIAAASSNKAAERWAVLAWPRAAQLDEVAALAQHAPVDCRWARRPEDLAGADVLLLPHSLAVGADLAWMREQGLDAAIAAHAQAGKRILALGAGAQMLAEGVIDSESIAGNGPGLGLLPLVAALAPVAERGLRPLNAQEAQWAAHWHGPWAEALAAVPLAGLNALEIGQTALHPAMVAAGVQAQAVLPQGLGWANEEGHVLALFVQGLLGQKMLWQALWPEADFSPAAGSSAALEASFERLAATVQTAFGDAALQSLLQAL